MECQAIIPRRREWRCLTCLRCGLADESKICGLGIADYLWSATGGYTYFDRDVPIYTSRHLTASQRPRYYEQLNFVQGPGRSPIPLRMHAVLRDRTTLSFLVDFSRIPTRTTILSSPRPVDTYQRVTLL